MCSYTYLLSILLIYTHPAVPLITSLKREMSNTDPCLTDLGITFDPLYLDGWPPTHTPFDLNRYCTISYLNPRHNLYSAYNPERDLNCNQHLTLAVAFTLTMTLT